ncbi:MAG TPA: protein phosphatase 2C domain-containing protein, partial [Deinococcales bacterium]|nr:protein phosphatase 2C domain-containing protein [Deinococcales bacterium]
MGTTCTVLVLDDQVGLVGHVGDSRAYLLRDGSLQQLTLDHSWVADRVRQGILSEEEARQHRWRNIITNTLGSNPEVKLDLLHFRVKEGDVILLCSDGVSMLLSPELMTRILTENPPEAACATLLEEANSRGSPDNITAVVLQVNRVEPKNKRYELPPGGAFEPVSVQLGETLGGVRQVEDDYPSRGFLGRMRRHVLYPYRFWLLGSLYLILLILLFSFWR